MIALVFSYDAHDAEDVGIIVDPDRLLGKLVNEGVIGPCSAIGTDWVTSERAGIIAVYHDP